MSKFDHGEMIETIKTLVPAAITLLIAATGWILTDRYNKTQLEIARRKNEGELEVARANAALDYLRVVASIPAEDVNQRREALAVAISVLPSQMAFDLAVRNLADDAGPLSELLRKHGSASWNYLVHFLEAPPREGDVEEARLQLPDTPPSSDVTLLAGDERQSALAGILLKHLDQERLLEPFYNYVLSSDYPRLQLRPNAILYCYRYFNSQDDYATPGPSENLTNRTRIQVALGDPKLSPETRAAVALAGCLAFASGDGDLGDESLMREAAGRFWVGLDIASGETPRETDIRGLVYRKRFTYMHGNTRVAYPGALERASSALRAEVDRVDLRSAPIAQATTLLYAYSESSPRGAPTPFTAFLLPQESMELVKAALDAANTPSRRRELAEHFGSLSGSILFRNISQSPPVGRQFAGTLSSWYRAWYRHDWPPAQFISDMEKTYPDMAPELRRQPWQGP